MVQHARLKSSTKLRTSWVSIPFSAMREITVMVDCDGFYSTAWIY